jgi:hypothetical protein
MYREVINASPQRLIIEVKVVEGHVLPSHQSGRVINKLDYPKRSQVRFVSQKIKL